MPVAHSSSRSHQRRNEDENESVRRCSRVTLHRRVFGWVCQRIAQWKRCNFRRTTFNGSSELTMFDDGEVIGRERENRAQRYRGVSGASVVEAYDGLAHRGASPGLASLCFVWDGELTDQGSVSAGLTRNALGKPNASGMRHRACAHQGVD
jgi:hypothetical protein